MFRALDRGSTADRLWVLGPALFWGIFAVYAIHDALPANPIRLPFEGAVNVRAIAPQGWAFFTRDPREPDIEVFSADDGWRRLLEPNNGAYALWGASRKARGQRLELGMLSTEISRWTRCRGVPQACLDRAPTTQRLANTYPIPTLCGELGFVKAPPVPWAWSGSGESIHMPSKISRVRVTC